MPHTRSEHKLTSHTHCGKEGESYLGDVGDVRIIHLIVVVNYVLITIGVYSAPFCLAFIRIFVSRSGPILIFFLTMKYSGTTCVILQASIFNFGHFKNSSIRATHSWRQLNSYDLRISDKNIDFI
uniref:Uncharacterized protein n=1 Tax=Glossina pallidipes TaxID=7398 RepID=A0A1A9Z3H6_GLOPL